MKTTLPLLAAMMLLLATSCQHGTQQETSDPKATDNPQESTIIIEEKDGVSLLCQGDNPLFSDGWMWRMRCLPSSSAAPTTTVCSPP